MPPRRPPGRNPDDGPSASAESADGRRDRLGPRPRTVAVLVAAILLVGVAGGVIGWVAGPALADVADTESGANATQANETVTLEAFPNLTIAIPDNRLEAGNETLLELYISNEADLPGSDADPRELRERVVTANDTRVEITDTREAPIEVTTGGPAIGTLERGDEDVVAAFLIRVPGNAEGGEYEIEVTLTYVNVLEIEYSYEDGELVTSERRFEVNDRRSITVVVEERDRGLLATIAWLLPPVIPGLILVVWLLGKRQGRAERTLNRLSRVFFDRFVSPSTNRERRIEAAYIGTNYRTYATKTLLFALLAFVAGGIAGGYFVAGALVVVEPLVRALAGLPRTITRPVGIHPEYTFEIASRTRWLVILGGGATIGFLTGVLAYVFRWQLPASHASVRKRGIEESLPRTTAFMYALSRGGMEFPEIARTLTEYRDIYGETAEEMSIAVREMDLFGRDMITALRRMSYRTPSEQFKTFAENLTSVLQSGSDLPAFFKAQYERFSEEAEERQEEVLELLATIAEAYVTIFVAGVLFFITILLVFGLTITDTLWMLQIIVYVMLPLASAAFALVLQQQLDALGIRREGESSVLERMKAATPFKATPRLARQRADGGHARTQDGRRTLGVYDRVERFKESLSNPASVFLWSPTKVLWVTVPIALLAFAVRFPATLQAEGVTLRVLDDLLIQSLLFVLATYAVARYFHNRHIRAIEAATPEFLERLASLNEAGMSVVQGLDRVREGDLGVLTPEVRRIWRDIEYGANVDDALIRFGRRVRTAAITRIVTLLVNALRASGDMGPVLRIASEQARSEVNLRERRQRQMFTYLIVIYVSFFVFLVIILAVNEVLVPSLPDHVPTPSGEQAQRLGASPDAFARFGDVDQAAYTLVFFHAALIQAVCAGFIGGQLGEGSLRDGAKHAAVMLALAYAAFVLLSSPIASIAVDSQSLRQDGEIITYEVTSDGDTLENIQKVTLSEGGYVAVYDQQGINGTMLGQSEYLPPGSHTDLSIPLDESLSEDTTLRLVVHRDTNGNEEFDFQQPLLPGTGQVDRPYSSPTQEGEPGIEVRVLVRVR